MSTNHILHIDMDAFFASVEQRDFPELRGKPVAVGGTAEQRSVIAAASYEARKFGVRSAMPSARAKMLCKSLIIRPVRMQQYAEVSSQIHEIFNEYTPMIEPISLDEAFLDVKNSLALFGSAEKIGHEIQEKIKAKTQLVASVGIAPNKFLAKMASDLEKPNGFVVITEENVIETLSPLPIKRIWGIGKTLAEKLNSIGIFTIAQLRNYPLDSLRSIAGKNAETLLELACGIDSRPVISERNAKSISSENTFSSDIYSLEDGLSVILEQVEEVAYKLRRINKKANKITLKLRYSDFKTLTRSKTLACATDSTQQLWDASKEIYRLWYSRSKGPLRLIGFGVSSLTAQTHQELLFGRNETVKQTKIDKSLDAIIAKYGQDSMKRGLIIKPQK